MLKFIKNLLKIKENTINANGKRIKADDDLLFAIWDNDRATDDQKINVENFCKLSGISRAKYYRLRSWKDNIKNEADRERLSALENEYKKTMINIIVK